MKNYALIITLVFLLACNDNKEKPETHQRTPGVEAPQPREVPSEEAEAPIWENEEQKTPDQSEIIQEGRYIRSPGDQAGTDLQTCNCNCLEVNYSTPTPLCLDKEKISISGKFEKTGNTSAAIFLVGPINPEEMGKNLPWEDFDKNVPIATLDFKQDGSMELDWKGFSINGELAVDYAIFGKKTLEGTYKKK